jgi:hypothetical protein
MNIEDSDDPTKTRRGTSSDSYVKRTVADVERELDQFGKMLPSRVMMHRLSSIDKRVNYY